MTTSGSERKEVAERLRAAAKTKSDSAYYLWKRLEIAVNGWRLGAVVDESYVYGNDVLSRLADLIDPTCEVADCGHQDRHLLTTACLSCHASAYRATAAGMRACMTCRMRADRDGDEMR